MKKITDHLFASICLNMTAPAVVLKVKPGSYLPF